MIIQKKNVVVDQGGNFWQPISSTIYYPNCRVIQVTRDPKAVFSSMKVRKSLSFPSNDLKKFFSWHKEINKRRNTIEEKKILRIKFEDFVLKNDQIIKKINKFLKLKFINLILNYLIQK